MSGVLDEKISIVFEGYMTKRAIVSGRNWKRRYFLLYSDGELAYRNNEHDSGAKKSITLTSKSKAMVLKELMSEGGVYVEGPTHDPLYLKAESMKEAKEWIRVLNEVITLLGTKEAHSRKANLDVFNKPTKQPGGGREFGSVVNKLVSTTAGIGSTRNLGSGSLGSGSATRAGAKEKRTPPPPEGGWLMRVGDMKTAKDVFVDANTWMYYENKEAYEKGGKVIGKAELVNLI
jgi:hypothetical protein